VVAQKMASNFRGYFFLPHPVDFTAFNVSYCKVINTSMLAGALSIESKPPNFMTRLKCGSILHCPLIANLLLFASEFWQLLKIMSTRKLSYRMTARCALCIWALKIFSSPLQRPRLLFPKFLMGFCSDWAYKCACKIWNL